MGEKHYWQNRSHHHPRRMGQSQPATTTRQQLRRELHPPPIRVKTPAHRQSPENADWLAVDLPNMRSLLHVYKMEHHHQNSQPPRTTTRNETTMTKAYGSEAISNALDHLIEAFVAPFKPKRQPITRVRRIWQGPNPITGRTFSTWYWQCALCDHNMKARETSDTHYGELCFTWEPAYQAATHHAHNHH